MECLFIAVYFSQAPLGPEGKERNMEGIIIFLQKSSLRYVT